MKKETKKVVKKNSKKAVKKVKKSKPKVSKKNNTIPEGIRKLGEFEQYGLFMALPKVEREKVFGFTTDQHFAKNFKVNPCTLTEWKTRTDLWDIRDKYLVVFKKHTAEILSEMASKAKKSGDPFSALTWMKLVEGFTERSGVDVTSKGKQVTGFRVVVHNKKQENGN